jgi:hypothetical protein
MIARRVSPALVALTALLTSCNKPEVQTYRVPKEPSAQPAMATTPPAPAPAAGSASATPPAGGSAMASTPVATASGADLTWSAPSHWVAKPGSPMRKGSFAIKGDGGEADLSITAFPGAVGGDLANLNRWREQVKLPPVSQAEFEASAQRLERNGLRMTVVDLAGTGAGATRILGAMIPYGSATWFVKLMGPEALVAKEKTAFMSFLDTVKAPAK